MPARNVSREELEYRAKLAALRAAIKVGDASGVARGDVFARVRRKLRALSRNTKVSQ